MLLNFSHVAGLAGGRLRPVDIATVVYLLILSGIILFFHRSLAEWGWYIAGHLVMVGLVLWIVWVGAETSSKILGFIRHWYPALLFYPLFVEMESLTTIIFGFWANGWLIQTDSVLVGKWPWMWLKPISTSLMNDLMAFFYLFYFLLIPIAGLPLYLRRKRKEFQSLLFTTALAYYSSFLAFLLFPAESPRVTLTYFPLDQLQGGILSSWLYSAQNFGGIHGGAFPSSHVAAAFAILLSTWRHARNIFYLLLVPVAGLALSTVYFRYHYAADAISGALLGTLCYFVGQRLYSIWEGARVFHSRRWESVG